MWSYGWAEEKSPSAHPNLMSVMVELNLRESRVRFPCKWNSVLGIYNGTAHSIPSTAGPRWRRSSASHGVPTRSPASCRQDSFARLEINTGKLPAATWTELAASQVSVTEPGLMCVWPCCDRNQRHLQSLGVWVPDFSAEGSLCDWPYSEANFGWTKWMLLDAASWPRLAAGASVRTGLRWFSVCNPSIVRRDEWSSLHCGYLYVLLVTDVSLVLYFSPTTVLGVNWSTLDNSSTPLSPISVASVSSLLHSGWVGPVLLIFHFSFREQQQLFFDTQMNSHTRVSAFRRTFLVKCQRMCGFC